MEDIVGKKILIHGYKHNGKIHRCWSKGLVLQETDDHDDTGDRRLITLLLIIGHW